MIELIFAIVIIAISVIAIPTLTQTTDNSVEESLVQEAIFATSAVSNEAMAYYWDSASQTDQNISAGLSRIVDVSSITGTTDCLAGSPNKRLGSVHRRCLSSLAISPTFTASSNSVEQIASAYNNTTLISDTAAEKKYATYKQDYKVDVAVTHCDDTTNPCVQFGTMANSPNIKQITADVKDSNGNILVRMRSYVMNIGELTPAQKVLP